MIDRIEESTSHESIEAAPVAETTAPARRKSGKRKPLKPPTLDERFAFGNFTIPEAAGFCCCSISTLHKAEREHRLEFVKNGGCTRIRGPELARYTNTKRGE
jgi:hypothetical protein